MLLVMGTGSLLRMVWLCSNASEPVTMMQRRKLQPRFRDTPDRETSGKKIRAMQFEYLVCQTQFSRVTFANGQWQGTIAIGSGDSQAALDSCPQVWDYLNQAGRAGWLLITAANATITNEGQTSQVSYQLFLKRERMSDNSF